MTKWKAGNNERGFTLIEVIVVMVIIGIAAAIAIPSLSGFTTSSGVTSAANDLVSAFNLARSEAVTRQLNVSVCKSGNMTSCDTSGTDWEQGWIVFSDVDGDGVVDGGTDNILRVYQSPGGSITMTAGASLANRLTYATTGFPNPLITGVEAARTITVTAGSSTIQVITNNTGRIRTNRP